MNTQFLTPEEIAIALQHCKRHQPIRNDINLVSLDDMLLSQGFDIDSALLLLESLNIIDEQCFPCEPYQHSGCFETVLGEYRKNSYGKALYRFESYLTPRGVMFLTLILEKTGCPQLNDKSFI